MASVLLRIPKLALLAACQRTLIPVLCTRRYSTQHKVEESDRLCNRSSFTLLDPCIIMASPDIRQDPNSQQRRDRVQSESLGIHASAMYQHYIIHASTLQQTLISINAHLPLPHLPHQVMRTCNEMGIKTVAIYSDADAQAVRRRVIRAGSPYYIIISHLIHVHVVTCTYGR